MDSGGRYFDDGKKIIKRNKMSEAKIDMDSGSESGSEIDSIDLLMESFVNLLEMIRELEKDAKKNNEMLEKVLFKLKSS